MCAAKGAPMTVRTIKRENIRYPRLRTCGQRWRSPAAAHHCIGGRLVQRKLGLVPNGRYHTVMDLQLTAVFRKVPEGYIGFVEELPGANTQGATLEEARANLQEAVEMVLQANRELIEEASAGGEVIREAFKVGA